MDKDEGGFPAFSWLISLWARHTVHPFRKEREEIPFFKKGFLASTIVLLLSGFLAAAPFVGAAHPTGKQLTLLYFYIMESF